MMAQNGNPPDNDRAVQTLNMALLGVVGVGCLTVLVIGAAILAGLWLDNQFQTKPFITIILVLASVPVTLYLIFRGVLIYAPRFQVITGTTSKENVEEEPSSGEIHREET
jgi:MFS-type transporter involved in bile tolerance (Atg22 family)